MGGAPEDALLAGAAIEILHTYTLIHDDLPLALRALRDLVGPEVERVRIDSRATVERARPFAQKYIPEIVNRIEYYAGERPLFDLYGVEDEIQKALERKVQYMEFYRRNFDNTEMATL